MKKLIVSLTGLIFFNTIATPDNTPLENKRSIVSTYEYNSKDSNERLIATAEYSYQYHLDDFIKYFTYPNQVKLFIIESQAVHLISILKKNIEIMQGQLSHAPIISDDKMMIAAVFAINLASNYLSHLLAKKTATSSLKSMLLLSLPIEAALNLQRSLFYLMALVGYAIRHNGPKTRGFLQSRISLNKKIIKTLEDIRKTYPDELRTVVNQRFLRMTS